MRTILWQQETQANCDSLKCGECEHQKPGYAGGVEDWRTRVCRFFDATLYKKEGECGFLRTAQCIKSELHTRLTVSFVNSESLRMPIGRATDKITLLSLLELARLRGEKAIIVSGIMNGDPLDWFTSVESAMTMIEDMPMIKDPS